MGNYWRVFFLPFPIKNKDGEERLGTVGDALILLKTMALLNCSLFRLLEIPAQASFF